MTEGYAERRKEYVAQIRSSFDREAEDVGSETAEEGAPSAFPFGKIRFLAAVVCAAVFLVNWYSGGTIFGYSMTEIIDIVADNHYYTNLQDYVLK